LCFHDRTNRTAGGKEKIGNIDLIPERFIGDQHAVLIYEVELRYFMINSIAIHYFPLAENGKWCFFFSDTGCLSEAKSVKQKAKNGNGF
jgi:hypothetical protein